MFSVWKVRSFVGGGRARLSRRPKRTRRSQHRENGNAGHAATPQEKKGVASQQQCASDKSKVTVKLLRREDNPGGTLDRRCTGRNQ